MWVRYSDSSLWLLVVGRDVRDEGVWGNEDDEEEGEVSEEDR